MTTETLKMLSELAREKRLPAQELMSSGRKEVENMIKTKETVVQADVLLVEREDILQETADLEEEIAEGVVLLESLDPGLDQDLEVVLLDALLDLQGEVHQDDPNPQEKLLVLHDELLVLNLQDLAHPKEAGAEVAAEAAAEMGRAKVVVKAQRRLLEVQAALLKEAPKLPSLASFPLEENESVVRCLRSWELYCCCPCTLCSPL
eukprot:TRINITY_DN28_c0_g1_i1.p2 TRINITY_DN28_c0_g1~~TRINITY_DN28_c0_g1_i1.p2  ORF type:complete len:205 (-),score=38.37 TRINITY_DN28_c0_g1_i1:444-1058(-)